MYNELSVNYGRFMEFLESLCWESVSVKGKTIINDVIENQNGFEVNISRSGRYERSSTGLWIPKKSAYEWTPSAGLPVQIISGTLLNFTPLLKGETDRIFNGQYVGVTPIGELKDLRHETIFGTLLANPVTDENEPFFERYLRES